MNARQRKAFEKISNNIDAWRQIEALGWGKTFDYEAIAEKLSEDPETKKRLSIFVGCAVRLLMELAPFPRFCSDDQLDDICSHIVGLGRIEFLRAVADPKKALLEHADTTEESFSYCFLGPEDE